MNQKYIVANWKMNGVWSQNSSFIQTLKQSITQFPEGVSVVICPPYPYLMQAKGLLDNSVIAHGAQNVSHQDNGAWTGEVSASMLQDLACTYAIVGHSERRAYYHEDDATIAAKAVKLLDKGIQPIICVGESLAQKQSGETQVVITAQLSALIAGIATKHWSNIVIAYEPIWSIGTGLLPSLTDIEDTCAHIQAFAQQHLGHTCSVLYGGSVKADNATSMANLPHVDGFLVGGASLDPAAFAAIIQAYI